ncbi:PR15A-like protein [Mya arenaria]|uniref:Protein DP71L n=1 Tax=Mya arenaria TaxID=6604 RepID=A0ABY7DYA8_MYAAR|nr:uncharacterized protein LOC128231851 [Mya arenaria]WAR01772.1 PR15A-like protein [Mya arenaria]
MNRDVKNQTRRSYSFDKNRNIPSLLRLDSTGEISSENRIKTVSRVNSVCNKTSVDNRDTACIQNINRKMTSCIQSASNYLGNFYPPQSVSNSLMTNNNKTNLFGYLADMFGLKPSTSCCSDIMRNMDMLNQNVPSESLANKSQCTPSSSCQSIFGAIHSRFISPKDIYNSNMTLSTGQKYIPPHKRTGTMFSNGNQVTKTPYNARLLEKSRQCHIAVNPNMPKIVLHQTPHERPDPPVMQQEPHAGENHSPKTQLQVEPLIHNAKTTCTPKIDGENRSPSPTLDVRLHDENKKTDWFDFPCVQAPLIPEQTEQSRNVECPKSECNSDSEPHVHSWFSVENDNEVKKVSSANSSQVETAENSAKALIHDDEKCIDSKKDVKNVPICMNVKWALIGDNALQKPPQAVGTPQKRSQSCKILKQEDTTPEVSESECATVKTHCEKLEKLAICDRIAVLYNRQSGKKSRPSKKKRTRQKAQQNQTNKSTLKPGRAIHPSSPVSFTLSVKPEICVNLHAFQFICDSDDSVSDWSDTDSDFDENFSSLEDDELGLRCNDIGSLGIIKISCDIPNGPEKESPEASTFSALDAINKSWQQCVANVPTPVHIDKKVHFAEKKQLATVHPIIAWSHAYAAARKGPWEEFARDRARFQRRVQESAKFLDPILAQSHRDKIFTGRFCTSN